LELFEHFTSKQTEYDAILRL